MLDKITRGVIILSLITFPQSYSSPSFAIERNNKEDLNFITKEEGYKNIQNQLEETKRLKAEQERLQKLKEEEEQRQREAEERKRIEEEKNSYNIEFELTYYSRHPSENGGYNKTASGKYLSTGMCANNIFPLGTRIILENGQVLVVEDRGSNKHFNNDYRLDVFVDTYDQEYVKSLGRKKIKGNKLGSHYIKGKIVKE